MGALLQTNLLFVLAGLAEIGGGWLMWQWLRAGRSAWLGLAGGLILCGYGVIPTLQAEAAFGCIYAAYGGIFVALSLLWAWRMDGWQPDRYDLVGAGIVLIGVCVILWGRSWPTLWSPGWFPAAPASASVCGPCVSQQAPGLRSEHVAGARFRASAQWP